MSVKGIKSQLFKKQTGAVEGMTKIELSKCNVSATEVRQENILGNQQTAIVKGSIAK